MFIFKKCEDTGGVPGIVTQRKHTGLRGRPHLQGIEQRRLEREGPVCHPPRGQDVEGFSLNGSQGAGGRGSPPADRPSGQAPCRRPPATVNPFLLFPGNPPPGSPFQGNTEKRGQGAMPERVVRWVTGESDVGTACGLC